MKTNDYIGYSLLFFGLVFFQIIVLNNLSLGTYIKPQIIFAFILLLPITINKTNLLLIACSVGLFADFLFNTNGLSTSSMLLIAFIRDFWLPKENNPRAEFNVVPGLQISLNAKWISYVYLLTVIYHFNYFLLDFFSLNFFFRIILVTILSSIFSIFVLWIIYRLFLKPKTR